jgi:hypothetical protein
MLLHSQTFAGYTPGVNLRNYIVQGQAGSALRGIAFDDDLLPPEIAADCDKAIIDWLEVRASIDDVRSRLSSAIDRLALFCEGQQEDVRRLATLCSKSIAIIRDEVVPSDMERQKALQIINTLRELIEPSQRFPRQ